MKREEREEIDEREREREQRRETRVNFPPKPPNLLSRLRGLMGNSRVGWGSGGGMKSQRERERERAIERTGAF